MMEEGHNDVVIVEVVFGEAPEDVMLVGDDLCVICFMS